MKRWLERPVTRLGLAVGLVSLLVWRPIIDAPWRAIIITYPAWAVRSFGLWWLGERGVTLSHYPRLLKTLEFSTTVVTPFLFITVAGAFVPHMPGAAGALTRALWPLAASLLFLWSTFDLIKILMGGRGLNFRPAKKALLRAGVVVLTLNLIARFGPDVLALWDASPDTLILFAFGWVALVTIWLVLNALRGASFCNVPIGAAELEGELAHPFELSPTDLKIAAVHEAGHVLVWGLLETPESAYIAFRNEARALGRVTGRGGNSVYYNEAGLRWSMLRVLAGGAAELLVLGERSSGGDNDLRKWEEGARLFLTLGFGGAYFRGPESEHEASVNAATLVELRKSQERELRGFLEVNRAVLEELVAALLERGTLTRNDLEPFVERLTDTSLFKPVGAENGGEA